MDIVLGKKDDGDGSGKEVSKESKDDHEDGLHSQETDGDDENNDESSKTKLPKKQKGRKGKRLRLITNYVRVIVDKPEAIHEYQVTFYPPVDNLDLRRIFIQKYGDPVLGVTRIYDGASLFLPKKLCQDMVFIEGNHPKIKDTVVKAKVVYKKARPGRELVEFFNILFRRVMAALGTTELKRTYLNKDVKIDLPMHKLQIWPGICTSVEQQEEGLLLLMDTSYRVFRTDTVYDYYCALKDSPDAKSRFMDYIIGKVVVTQYNNFTYRVDDVDWERSPFSNFDCNGTEISYADYLKEQYNASSIDEYQPLLLSRIKVIKGHKVTDKIKIVSLVPQLCFVSGMEEKDHDDEKVMKHLRRYTFTSPVQRVKALAGFLKRLKEIPEAQYIFKEWNCTVEDSLLNVEGREISGPTLYFGNGNKLNHTGADFSDQAVSNCLVPIPLKKWIIICTGPDKNVTQEFVKHYKLHCTSIGIEVPILPEIVSLKGSSPQDFREALEDYAVPEITQFVIVVMPFPRNEIYSLVKKICIGERGIPSQVVYAKTLQKNLNKQVMSNLTSQINCKLGGSPWGLIIPVQEQIMMVGIDVYHDVRKINSSVIGLVASLNNSCTRYFTKTHFQRVHQEIAENMRSLFMEILDAYHEANGMYPKRIVIFRDGGCVSNVEMLTEHEVKPMLSAISELSPSLEHFNYVLVSKRVPQRFYVSGPTANSVSNAPLGTIIDSSVTYPKMYDFYVISQELHVGCIQPTHYWVISDVGGTPPDFLQKLAFSTSFMFFNWSGSIRVPAMIQYAHKVSSLVGRSMRMEPSQNLQNSLFYL